MKITGYNFYDHLFEKIRKLLRKQNNLIIDMKMRFHLKKKNAEKCDSALQLYEPHRVKTGFLPRRKQRR